MAVRNIETMDDTQNPVQEPMTIAGLNPSGSIGPESRIVSGELTASELEQVCNTLAQDGPYAATAAADIEECIDGRKGAPGKQPRPKAAGGTESIVVGLALAGFCRDTETCVQQTARVAGNIIAHGHKVGGHTANVVHGDTAMNCGCGACDKLKAGLQFLAQRDDAGRYANADNVRGIAQKLGVNIDQSMSDEFARAASVLLAQGYADDGGRAIVDEIAKAGGPEAVDELQDEHLEVAVVFNRVTHETLDKEKLEQLVGPNVQAFCVDIWAMRQAAYDNAPNPADADRIYAAMIYHNVAIAAVLCDASLRVVVH